MDLVVVLRATNHPLVIKSDIAPAVILRRGCEAYSMRNMSACHPAPLRLYGGCLSCITPVTGNAPPRPFSIVADAVEWIVRQLLAPTVRVAGSGPDLLVPTYRPATRCIPAGCYAYLLDISFSEGDCWMTVPDISRMPVSLSDPDPRGCYLNGSSSLQHIRPDGNPTRDELSHGDRDSPGSMGASGPTGYLGPLPSECRYGRKSDTPNESMAISGAREASTTANDSGVSTGLSMIRPEIAFHPTGPLN
ncbi:hypothetical protein An03g05410 [Aspergillus niger]|uniref:Uncharacterized protein n=2 Tax=Aspergillus niger TaxID=5061 RepID=A2QH33_ASPNC|nr:hypothetical protein An03g05410 [Aspergillus niger]CAK38303.1 hypothetical protein An03g05410 [Aspergillus niger]